MDHTQIEALARSIADQTIQQEWLYWFVLLLLVFLGVVLGSFLGSYWAKRGEVAAARSDRKEILDGLRQTTKAAEEVRSAISLNEWTERERRTLRRMKLEEMLLLAYKTREWLSDELNRVADQKLPEKPSPQPTLMALGKLYFPELRANLRAFDRACDLYSQILGSTRIEVMMARARSPANAMQAETAATAAINAASDEVLKRQEATLIPLFELETAASDLMAKIIAPPE